MNKQNFTPGLCLSKLTKKQKQLYADVLCEERIELYSARLRRTAFKLLAKLPEGTLKIFTLIGTDGEELGEYIGLPTQWENYKNAPPLPEVRPWFYCTECGEELRLHEKDVEMCDKCREKIGQEEKQEMEVLAKATSEKGETS